MRAKIENKFHKIIAHRRAIIKWSNIITAWYLSDKSAKIFCEENYIDIKDFRKWLYKINLPRPVILEENPKEITETKVIDSVKFIPVKIKDINDELLENPTGIDLLLFSGHRIRITKGFDEETLINILTVMRELSC